MADLKKGDRIMVKADPVLGTPDCMATITEVAEWGYYVKVDDEPDYEGTVDKEGNPVQLVPW